MKIIVIGQARSGSTRLTEALAGMYGVPDLGEISDGMCTFNENKTALIEMGKMDSFCAKIIPDYLPDELFDYIDWASMDIVVTSIRKSNVDSFLSFCYAKIHNQWIRSTNDIWPHEKFTADITKFPFWLSYYKIRQDLYKRVNKLITVNMIEFDYEIISDPTKLCEKILMLPGNKKNPSYLLNGNSQLIPTGVNYKELCTNYSEIVGLFIENNVYS